jgi:hypothetical protein
VPWLDISPITRYEDSPKPVRSGLETRNCYGRSREEQRIMIQNLLILAQEDSTIFNMRNLILLGAVIILLVVYKVYKNKQMND